MKNPNYILKFLILSMGFVFVLTSCKSESPVEILQAEIMDMHHKDMVTWGQIPDLKKSLKEKKDALMSGDKRIDSTQVVPIENAMKELEAAHESMMEWMGNYKAPDKDEPVEEALKYLQEQKASMEETGNLINEALISAKDILGSNSEN